MTELIPFLRARIAEDLEYIDVVGRFMGGRAPEVEWGAMAQRMLGWVMDDPDAHRIVERLFATHVRAPNDVVRIKTATVGKLSVIDLEDYDSQTYWDVLLLMAGPYFDHPDFDPTWVETVGPVRVDVWTGEVT